MIELSNVVQQIPPMLSGQELMTALEVLPEYDNEIYSMNVPTRLMALNDLYKIYVPNQMSTEIYSKLYLALLRSLQKKETKLVVQQQNQNFKAILQQEYSGIIGGSDSFTIIGPSGLGKSSAISRAIRKVVWAVQKIQTVGRPLSWTRIYELTNIHLPNFKACLPYIGNYADETLAKELRELV